MDEFYEYFKDIELHLNWCYDPDFLQPWILPQSVKDIIIEKIQKSNHIDQYTRNNIIETMKKPSDEVLLDRFKTYNERLDSYRSSKFSEIFPELAEII